MGENMMIFITKSNIKGKKCYSTYTGDAGTNNFKDENKLR